jgi:murein DD-endopeptidase MepM/ murein hydrolase activator NlpD
MTQFLKRTAVILAGAGSLAACTTYEPFETTQAQPQGEAMRPQYPINRPSAPQPAPSRQPAPGPYQPVPARPTEPVQGKPLPPASRGGPAYVTPSTPPAPAAPPQSSYQPLPPPPPVAPPLTYQPTPPPPPAPPPTKTVTRTSITGKVVEVEGPRVSYTVKKGDNLDGIGRKLDLDRKTLAELNDLKSPYTLQPGDVLKGPKTKRKAYVVGSGDTLSAIARRFSVSAKALAEENDLRVSANLKPNQKVRLPEGYKDKGPIKTTVTVPAPELAPPPRPTPAPPPAAPPPPTFAPPPSYTPQPSPPPAPRPQPAPAPAPTQAPKPPAPAIIPTQPSASDAEISQLGRGVFIWPVRGDVISTYGVKGTSQKNDGINIRAAANDTVRAAAAGDVVYAGDQVPGFGNLVLVKHADGWVTAYGHLSRSDVKMQQKVVQGQQLGTVGQTGGASEPQLHFEVRYAPTPADRARPIDPMLVLPK